jgi:hypothetical protein
VGECTQDGPVKIGNEERCTLTIEGKGSHKIPP